MTPFTLVSLPADSRLFAQFDLPQTSSSGGSPAQRDFALAVALVGIAAALVLAFVGA